jgi:hypothetical protein
MLAPEARNTGVIGSPVDREYQHSPSQTRGAYLVSVVTPNIRSLL